MGFGFRVSGFRFRVSGLGFRVSGFEFRVSGGELTIIGRPESVPLGWRRTEREAATAIQGSGFRISG